jgi:thiol-disulfide isomerase/thioredoxin
MSCLRVIFMLLLCVCTAQATPAEPQSDEALLSSLKVAIDAGDISRIQTLMSEVDRRGKLTLSKHGSLNSEEKEKAAAELLTAIRQLVANADIQDAKTKIAELESKYSGTRALRSAARISVELALIGSAAPEVQVDSWLANADRLQPLGTKTTVLIFWEEWCPHCRIQVPRLNKLFERYGSSGLQVIGITRVTKSSTQAKVIDFIKAQGVTYPIGQDIKNADNKGTLSTAFSISGIPAVGVVKDGTIIWRGHPAALKDELVAGWLRD